VTQNGPDGATAPRAPVAGAAGPAAAESAGDPPQGVIDLLGLLAYAFSHFRLLRDRIQELDVDPDEAMRPFVAAIDEFHARTAPSDWLESLVKAYVGDGIAADFYRTVAELLDPQTRDLVLEVLKDTGHAGFAVARVRKAIEADPRVAGRLALWARRLVGEALGQAQRVAAEREALAGLLAGGEVSQLGEIGRMFAQLTDAHARRMAALGLTA